MLATHELRDSLKISTRPARAPIPSASARERLAACTSAEGARPTTSAPKVMG